VQGDGISVGDSSIAYRLFVLFKNKLVLKFFDSLLFSELNFKQAVEHVF